MLWWGKYEFLKVFPLEFITLFLRSEVNRLSDFASGISFFTEASGLDSWVAARHRVSLNQEQKSLKKRFIPHLEDFSWSIGFSDIDSIFRLPWFQLGYLASIIQLGINVGGNQLETFWNSTVLSTQVYSECGTTSYNDTWRCTTLKDIGMGECHQCFVYYVVDDYKRQE